MNEDTKIVFIHKGTSWYLPYAIYQAKNASPNSDIVLIAGHLKYQGINVQLLEQLHSDDMTWECGLCVQQHGSASGHVSYWTIDALDEFCNLIIESFLKQEYLERYKNKWAWHQAQRSPGGVCDMTTLDMFYEANNRRIINLIRSYRSNVFDDNINEASNYEPDEYLTEGGMKAVKFMLGLPSTEGRR